ncbi:hypothetical protein [Pseudomonas sp. PDM27]|uniref:hypothetical protein n=1 Tax=Pseudomonas sp. PDM27 TaxID=2854769 RepID=UPI001C482AEF|nr:hypothetical protein [Pseudomonas sp. PDM27]MBV7569648.1 hypothetical protein [Pseudomonas sp. PDM27]
MSETPRTNKNLPRHGPGSMELQGGTGPITTMCSCGSFLEIYKQDKTFRIQAPESIDPDETNPDAPWVASPVADVGSSNLTVARVLLQAREMLEAAIFDEELDREAVILHLHSCKETLLACERLATRLAERIDEIIKQITEQGIAKDNRGRGLNPFPQVQDLDLDCGAFLIQANRVIKLVCELPALFIKLGKTDSNFDHLSKRLSDVLGEASPASSFVRENSDGVRYLIELRNFHEHPPPKKKKKTRTVIENFRVLPNGQIQTPAWHLEGQETSTPRPIKEEATRIVEFIRDTAEAMFIHLLMHRISKKLPYYIIEVPSNEVISTLPSRYRLSIDITKTRVEI